MTSKFFVFSLAALSFATVSCTTAEPIVGPDGTTNQLIKCPNVQACYQKATEVCGGPYKIINTTNDTTGAYGSTSTTYQMLVKCGR